MEISNNLPHCPSGISPKRGGDFQSLMKFTLIRKFFPLPGGKKGGDYSVQPFSLQLCLTCKSFIKFELFK
jgi:hypothetical protein